MSNLLKRVLSMAVALVMVFSLIPVTSLAAETNAADIATFNGGKQSTSYKTYTTENGWTLQNGCVYLLTDTNQLCAVINGKTSAVGSLTSPTLSGGIQELSISYTNVYSESNGVDFTITVTGANGTSASYRHDDDEVTKNLVETLHWTLDEQITGDFTIVVTNNSPTGSTSNKDRMAIPALTWTSAEAGACEHTSASAGVVTAPTCTTAGYTTYTCDLCGEEYTADPVAALDHSYDEGEVTTAATCTSNGVLTKTCTVANCGATATSTIYAIDHTYADGVCSVCGRPEPVAPVAGTAYKWFIEQITTEKFLYFTGAMDGYYGATSENVEDAVDMYVEETEGGFYLYFVNAEGTKQYINVVASGTYINFKIEEAASSVYTYSTEHNTLVTAVNGTDYYLGTYGTYKTFSASKLSYLPSNTSFASHFYAIPVEEEPDADGLKLGDNAVETAAGLAGGSWTYTPEEDGTLTVAVTAVSLYDDAAGEYVDNSDGLVYPIFWNSNFTMSVGGNAVYSATGEIAVTAGTPVEITLAHNQGTAVKATITLSMGEGGEGGETEEDGSENAPWTITELPWSWTVQSTHDNHFKYTPSENCTLVITHPDECYVSGLTDYTQAENGDYIVNAVAGETITLNPWTMSAADVSYTYTMAVQANAEPSEPNGTENNPYIIDEAPVTFNAVVAEDYASVYYKFDATKAGAISDNAPEGVFVYYYVNGEMVSTFPDPVTYEAGDEVKVEVYAWTAGTYEITLSDPTVAKIGDAIYTDLSDALEAANEAATAEAPVTVTLVADAFENDSYLTIDENVILDMGAFDVYAKSLNVLTGGKLSGVEYKQGADWAMIHLPSDSRMVMSGIVVKNDGSIGAIPVWDDDASCYVFGGAFFRSSNYIVAIDETAKSISFKFFPSLRTDLMKGYFQDANEMRDNGLRLVLRLTWPGADENGDINGEAQQDFVYSSEFVKVFMEKLGSARFTFLLTGYDTMITDEALAEMTITPMIVADNGMVFAGETVEVADYLQ